MAPVPGATLFVTYRRGARAGKPNADAHSRAYRDTYATVTVDSHADAHIYPVEWRAVRHAGFDLRPPGN